MIKEYSPKNSSELETLLDTPIFNYIGKLYDLKLITREEMFSWASTFEVECLKVEHKVTEEDIFNHIKNFFQIDTSNKEIKDWIKSPLFARDKVINKIISNRVTNKAYKASKEMSDIMKNALQTVIDNIDK